MTLATLASASNISRWPVAQLLALARIIFFSKNNFFPKSLISNLLSPKLIYMAYPRGRRTPLKRKATYGRGTKRFARSQYRRAYFNRRRGVGRKEKGADVSFTTDTVLSHRQIPTGYLSLERDPRRGWIMESDWKVYVEQIN